MKYSSHFAMQDSIIQLEPIIRIGFFFLFFAVIVGIEKKFTWRPIFASLKERFFKHFCLLLISTFLVRLVFPVVLVELAIKVQQTNQVSLFQLPELSGLPFAVQFCVSFLLLDLIMYWQHRIFHRYGLLWRMHLAHHSDSILDLTTGIRFHPLEMLFLVGLRMLGVILIGPPILAVLLFEIVFNAFSMFVHSNTQLPPRIEKILRKLIVTPGMHRVHHSDIPQERDANFGIIFSFWDKMLGTYRAYSHMGDYKIIVGLEEFRDPKEKTLFAILLQPFYLQKKRKKKPQLRKMMRN
ncbi:MAG TPA: sterol desaturase family protein [Gammaproteobacteria bacterium]|nr:sterol desaturase family protein [Gammaproteobacteria bacterium]